MFRQQTTEDSIHANRLKTYHDPQDRRLQPNEHQTTGIGTNAQDEIDGLLQDQTEQLQNREISTLSKPRCQTIQAMTGLQLKRF